MSPESTDFLYPFIEGDETDSGSLLTDLAASAGGKWAQSTALRAETLERCEEQLRTVAAAMVERFSAGGRLYAFGNGGSATDAEGVAQLYTRPPWGRPLPARSLAEDQAVLTALSNDIGFDVVFSRQLIAHGRRSDIAMGFSTSGNSENLLVAFAEARRQGMLTVGLSGYDGGRMAADPTLEHCLVVRSDSVHRIQESQASLTHVLWAYVQEALTSAPLPA
ncbi:MAG TPA: SIS domain-containing protein [Acidimicrobiales bacterium]|nr:SIS domain-containing protein [Acidimicrobiales bacterium]